LGDCGDSTKVGVLYRKYCPLTELGIVCISEHFWTNEIIEFGSFILTGLGGEFVERPPDKWLLSISPKQLDLAALITFLKRSSRRNVVIGSKLIRSIQAITEKF
jgi:hypothetical protein